MQDIKLKDFNQFEKEFTQYLSEYESDFDEVTLELKDIATAQANKLNLIEEIAILLKRIGIPYKYVICLVCISKVCGSKHRKSFLIFHCYERTTIV